MQKLKLIAKPIAIPVGLLLVSAASAGDYNETRIPTGQFITPFAAPGAVFQPLNPHLMDFPDYTVGQAMSEVLSPDGATLLILTSGYNRLNDPKTGKQVPADSNEYVFVYDVSGAAPKEAQVIQVPNTFAGIAFAPDGKRFYVSGGGDDDVQAFALDAGQWKEAGEPIKLGHKTGNGIDTPPAAAGLAVTADGRRLVVANYFNDSVSIVDTAANRVTAELDLRPGKSGGKTGTPGGENPFWVSAIGNSTVYVSIQRDREVDVVDISAAPRLIARIPVQGTPNKMLLDADQKHLYVACDNSDVVTVIDTGRNRVSGVIPTLAPPGLVNKTYHYRGVAPNSLALSADGKRLYVTDGGTNSVAVVALDLPSPAVVGLIPTGWYPQAVVAGGLQPELYVVNSRSNPGPNPSNPNHRGHPVESKVANQYVLQLEKAGFLTLPLPTAGELATLTQQVMANDGFGAQPTDADRTVMAALHRKIKHVIYIIKENRTYDQVLGDLGKGNGDSKITEFGQAITPNFHAIADRFVDMDNFYVSGEVSSEGWPWSTAARESDQGVKTVPVAYASRGVTADTNGLNRGVNVAFETQQAREAANPDTPADPDLLPGNGDVAGVDGPGGQVQQGYLWSAALRAHLSVRNYGMQCDPSRYDPDSKHNIPRDLTPYAHHLRVTYAAIADLVKITDPYYRTFDPAFPDFYREQEWEREFSGFEKDGKLPALSLLWLPGDHMGDFKNALKGVNTPELQQADNDYAVGKLIQKVAASPYAKDTLIFILEDDAQDGPDHVDAHRSTAYVIGPYVKQGTVVSDYYTTVNLLRTIEDVLGIDHLSIFDANQRPMTDLFDLKQASWSFTATPSALLANTQLPIPGLSKPGPGTPKPTRPAVWWAERTQGMDFSSEDKVDAIGFNRIVWQGLMTTPYPEERGGADLRAGSGAPLNSVTPGSSLTRH